MPLLASYQDDRRGVLSVSDWDPRVSGGRQSGRNPRNGLVGDPGSLERFSLFGPSSKHVWVTRFEPNDRLALSHGVEHPSVDLLLRDLSRPAAFLTA
jgi:hypothetical protein